ncbi:MAG: ribosome silencing factor [Candidatus Kapaibacteriales bacterium]
MNHNQHVSKELAKFLAQILIEKLAQNILILDLSSIETAPADFFVICSCDSDTQMRAVVDEVVEKCRELNLAKPRIEGTDSKHWILVDFFDVVLHVMYYETRKFYNLERLWSDGNFYKISFKTNRIVKVRNKAKLLSGIYIETNDE